MDNVRILAPGSPFALSQQMTTRQASGFGVVLREMREAQSISQSELAHLCGMQPSMVSRMESRMESGQRRPGLVTLARLFDGLQCSNEERSRLLNAAVADALGSER